MAAETLKFQTNVAEVIALQFAEGREVQSQYSGDQVMFSLVDGRRMYVAPSVAAKIAEAGIGPNTPFEICKRETARGNRRTIEFEIKNLGEVEPARPAKPVLVSGLVSGPRNGSNGHNGNGHASAPAAPAAPPPAPQGVLDLMRNSGLQSIDIVLEVEGYARAKGMTDFTFGAENIQKIWTTLFIDLRKNGVRS
jgi:hypothetical protein